MRLLPDEPKATDGPLFLEQNDLGTPVAALAGASREVLGVGDLVERMLVEANDALQQTDPSRLAAISTLEGRVDRVQHEIKVYVSRVGQSEIAEEQRRHAMDIVDYAINQVSSLRGRLGAFQKFTVGSTINSLNVAYENVSSAESSIVDTNFAAETANMTRAQILVQATTSVLSTANSTPQSVLSLLRGA